MKKAVAGRDTCLNGFFLLLFSQASSHPAFSYWPYLTWSVFIGPHLAYLYPVCFPVFSRSFHPCTLSWTTDQIPVCPKQVPDASLRQVSACYGLKLLLVLFDPVLIAQAGGSDCFSKLHQKLRDILF